MILEFLQQEFSRRSKVNPSYSLRAFASALNTDSSTMSALFKGKRPLSLKMAQRFLTSLEVPVEKRQKLMSTLVTSAPQLSDQYQCLDEEAIEALSSWHYYALLSLLKLKKQKHTPFALAKAIDLPLGITLEALGRLEKLGLIKKQGERWKVEKDSVTTPKNVPRASIRKAQREYIEKAITAIESCPVEKRDITGTTMAIKQEKVVEAQKLITKFRRELCEYLEEGEPNSVYRLNIQLYPITK